MTKVQVGEHRLVNIKRRSLCDNCVADVCLKKEELANMRVMECDIFRSPFIAFKKCISCGRIFEVFSNFRSLDYDKCPECNENDG